MNNVFLNISKCPFTVILKPTGQSALTIHSPALQNIALTNVTLVSSLPRWAKALPSLWITRSISTVTLMLAPLTKPAPVTA